MQLHCHIMVNICSNWISFLVLWSRAALCFRMTLRQHSFFWGAVGKAVFSSRGLETELILRVIQPHTLHRFLLICMWKCLFFFFFCLLLSTPFWLSHVLPESWVYSFPLRKPSFRRKVWQREKWAKIYTFIASDYV